MHRCGLSAGAGVASNGPYLWRKVIILPLAAIDDQCLPSWGWNFVILSPIHAWNFVWLDLAKVLFMQSQLLWVHTIYPTLPFLKAQRSSQREEVTEQRRSRRKTGKARTIGDDSHFFLKSVYSFQKEKVKLCPDQGFYSQMQYEHTLQIPLNFVLHYWMSSVFSYTLPNV